MPQTIGPAVPSHGSASGSRNLPDRHRGGQRIDGSSAALHGPGRAEGADRTRGKVRRGRTDVPVAKPHASGWVAHGRPPLQPASPVQRIGGSPAETHHNARDFTVGRNGENLTGAGASCPASSTASNPCSHQRSGTLQRNISCIRPNLHGPPVEDNRHPTFILSNQHSPPIQIHPLPIDFRSRRTSNSEPLRLNHAHPTIVTWPRILDVNPLRSPTLHEPIQRLRARRFRIRKEHREPRCRRNLRPASRYIAQGHLPPDAQTGQRPSGSAATSPPGRRLANPSTGTEDRGRPQMRVIPWE